ncbi:Embryonic stem cell-specific 5-hydroxymethylcytosine-binding protein [Erysiphe neolycopersici]|uniref:Embryonic stem cell-specific 5-hydroxymethylcytosine-binding protein n=1 Tax=Erysiphe neolycopersici TaxID=212602 RepID=A0A420HCB8_9PEZI|nr:Embryonic stem cell-specific 5-hydroxymethylcytosine-binding protein [Erysiphe neolycopersici]
MCGRYALGLRPHEIITALENNGMDVLRSLESQVGDVPLPNFNLAPGNLGLVYLAQKSYDKTMIRFTCDNRGKYESTHCDIQHKLQVMKWGLIPSWTKRLPDYGTLLKTINCRDDSLKLNKGLWNSMKATKRCVIIAQGFFEWLKKMEKIPHFIKRKDGKLLCLAGLYDCVEFEGTKEKNYTYTIITTNSNRQLEFLHDRMPVILENGSNELRMWLDPRQSSWSQDLQALLKPFDGDLEIYPVTKDVGKLSKNSPRLIVPIASSENKSNIANFFSKNAVKIVVGTDATNIKSEAKSGVVHTSPKFNIMKQEDLESKNPFELKNIKTITPQRQSPKVCELGQKRKLSDSLDNEQKKKIIDNIHISSTGPLILTSQKNKNPAYNSTPKPTRAKIRNKEELKITNFFK